jgi:GAF domain-containing protein
LIKNPDFDSKDEKRLETLVNYNILDTPVDGSFDRITKLAALLFKVPIAIISLVDSDRIWFKSQVGLSVNQIDRNPGLCASAILSDNTYIIENAITDPRALANPLVAGDFGLRFYAGAPLQTKDCYNLGTLCILDKTPRTFTAEEKEILEQLAQIVMDEMDLRLALRNTVSTIRHLSADISDNLKDTISNIEQASGDDEKAEVLSYLEASRMYLLNVENKLNHL